MNPGRSQTEITQEDAARNSASLHQSAWPDMFVNLQSAYAELTQAQMELEQRAAEIEELRDLFERVIESMSEALFVVDVAGRVVRVNGAAGVLLRRDSADLLGKPLQEVCGTDKIPATPWQLLRMAPGGSLQNLDVEMPTAAGHIPTSLSCGLIRDKRGKVTGVLVVARDITERKRTEQMLAQQAQELARSNAELEQFAYVASHDLQEPLRMLVGFTDLLVQEYQERLDGEAKEYLHFIADGARRMQRLISDLLSYARVGTRGEPFSPIPLPKALEQALQNLQASIAEHGAQVRTGKLPTVMGDETQLVQLFQNLIGNAIKFHSERPIEIHIGAKRRGGMCECWVRDNGIGFDPQFSERIFTIFQRLHGRDEYSGTGIGLAVCKKIVERHGGRIWVKSGPGEGSIFYFTLPAAEIEGEAHGKRRK